MKASHKRILFAALFAAALVLVLARPLFFDRASGVSDEVPGKAGPAVEPAAVVFSPCFPEAGGALRIVAVFETDPGDVGLALRGTSGVVMPEKARRGGGPAFWLTGAFPRAPAESVTVEISGRDVLPRAVGLVPLQDPPGGPPGGPHAGQSGPAGPGTWVSEKGWTAGEELLYSAWIQALFADSDERSSWDALHEVTRDPERNFLHNHLGLDEDGPGGMEMTPDCADNPYFLRAYFSWKRGLPFGFRECTRGSLVRAPASLRWLTNETVGSGGNGGRGGRDPVRSFDRFLRIVKNAIHSGSARTGLEDEETDTYPLPLSRESLRPGTVFADPYGHTLVVVRWVPQTEKRPGALLAVDAQPDGTIGIKRFWRGNFLFATEDVVGDPGFKAFRPIVMDENKGRRARPATNAEIGEAEGYGTYSLRQKNMGRDEFYDVMERLINPEPLDPVSAFRSLFEALHEQLLVRVESVANGEAYMRARPGAVIPMPSSSAAVFQTMGLWEDFSTPNRDLRLLIAMDAVLGFPERVAAMPEAYRIPGNRTPEEARRELLALHEEWAAELSIGYVRSDGSSQVLGLDEIFRRIEAFEMAYNPNDCVEVRWGAPNGSEEMRSCRRRAPAYQIERMKALRVWFKKRLHPPT